MQFLIPSKPNFTKRVTITDYCVVHDDIEEEVSHLSDTENSLQRHMINPCERRRSIQNANKQMKRMLNQNNADSHNFKPVLKEGNHIIDEHKGHQVERAEVQPHIQKQQHNTKKRKFNAIYGTPGNINEESQSIVSLNESDDVEQTPSYLRQQDPKNEDKCISKTLDNFRHKHKHKQKRKETSMTPNTKNKIQVQFKAMYKRMFPLQLRRG